MKITISRLPDVIKATGRARPTVYDDIKRGTFCKQVKIGRRAMGFLTHEVDAITAARVAGKSESEIKQLVLELHAQRGEGFSA